MDFGLVIKRIGFQLLLALIAVLFVILANPKPVMVAFTMLACALSVLPAVFISAAVLAPLEYFFTRIGIRWAIVIAPAISGAAPLLLIVKAKNMDNFTNGLSLWMQIFAVWGVLWLISGVLTRKAPSSDV